MLAWIDLEMTGLDPARHTIVEIACLITDDDLTIIEEGPDLVVPATPEQLADMDDFVRSMHTRSGLLADIEASTLTLAEAGAQTLAFLKRHIPQPRTVPLAGNSIGTDRRFLAQLCPRSRTTCTTARSTSRPSRSSAGAGAPRSTRPHPPRRAATAPCRTSARASPSWPTTAPPSSTPPPP